MINTVCRMQNRIRAKLLFLNLQTTGAYLSTKKSREQRIKSSKCWHQICVRIMTWILVVSLHSWGPDGMVSRVFPLCLDKYYSLSTISDLLQPLWPSRAPQGTTALVFTWDCPDPEPAHQLPVHTHPLQHPAWQETPANAYYCRKSI